MTFQKTFNFQKEMSICSRGHCGGAAHLPRGVVTAPLVRRLPGCPAAQRWVGHPDFRGSTEPRMDSWMSGLKHRDKSAHRSRDSKLHFAEPFPRTAVPKILSVFAHTTGHASIPSEPKVELRREQRRPQSKHMQYCAMMEASWNDIERTWGYLDQPWAS